MSIRNLTKNIIEDNNGNFSSNRFMFVVTLLFVFGMCIYAVVTDKFTETLAFFLFGIFATATGGKVTQKNIEQKNVNKLTLKD